MNLNLEKVDERAAVGNFVGGDCEAIADLSQPASSFMPAHSVNHPTSNVLRQRALLGGVSIDETCVLAQARCTPQTLNPFRFLGAASGQADEPLPGVPISDNEYHDIGMKGANVLAAASTASQCPAAVFELSMSKLIDDVPPEVAEAMEHYANRQKNSGSFKIWEVCWKLVIALCLQWKRNPLPMSEGTATGIVLKMAQCGYSFGYIRNVRWTIHKAHEFAGLPDPTLGRGFRAYKKLVAKDIGTEPKHRKAAILFHDLRRIGEVALGKGTLVAMQEWLGICLEYFSVLRRENFVDLDIQVTRRVSSGYEIHIPCGKNHQTRPRDIFIAPIPWDPLICPVANLDRWLALRAKTGPVFCHFGPGGVLTEQRLSSRTLTNRIKRYVQAIGLPPEHYSTQSLRAGMITQALLNGVGQADLRELTGHGLLESLDPYYQPGAHAPNLSIAATYGTQRPDLPLLNLVTGGQGPVQALIAALLAEAARLGE